MLSKSKFIKGEQCHRALWQYVHEPCRAVVTKAQQNIFRGGTDVGLLARDYFPGGVLAVEGDYPTVQSARRTMELIENGVETIYEATFIFDGTLAAVDILSRDGDGWHLYECKSSTSVKPTQIRDVAIQTYVIIGAGIPLMDASVMYLNNQYVRRGDLDIQQLFTHESVYRQVTDMQADMPRRISELRVMLEQDEPLIPMGQHCTSPYSCEFQEYCKSLLSLKDPEPVIETDDTPSIRHDSIRERLSRFGYPIYYLDFETIGPAVPMFDESRPYQQIPFQYSLHYQTDKRAEPIHSEYLAWPEGDPRPALIRQLIEDTLNPGKILTYNQAFEQSRLREMALNFPEYADDLQCIIDRLDDMMPFFRRKEMHYPSMGKGYSIKAVLPLMVPGLSYNDLEINNGGDASALFLELFGSSDAGLIEKTRQDLLKYCHLDTLAMVRILGELEGSVD